MPLPMEKLIESFYRTARSFFLEEGTTPSPLLLLHPSWSRERHGYYESKLGVGEENQEGGQERCRNEMENIAPLDLLSSTSNYRSHSGIRQSFMRLSGPAEICHKTPLLLSFSRGECDKDKRGQLDANHPPPPPPPISGTRSFSPALTSFNLGSS